MTERLVHLGIMQAYMMALEPLEHAMVYQLDAYYAPLLSYSLDITHP